MNEIKEINKDGLSFQYVKSKSYDIVNIWYYAHNDKITPQLQQMFYYGVYSYSKDELVNLVILDAKEKGLVVTLNEELNEDELYNRGDAMFKINFEKNNNDYSKEGYKKRYKQLLKESNQENELLRQMEIQGEMSEILKRFPGIIYEVYDEVKNPTNETKIIEIEDFLTNINEEGIAIDIEDSISISRISGDIVLLYYGKELIFNNITLKEIFNYFNNKMKNPSGNGFYDVSSITIREFLELINPILLKENEKS